MVEDAAGQRRSIHRVVGPGGSFGAAPLAQHVGLGASARRVDVEIWWPTTNTHQRFENVRKNQWIQVEEFAERYTPLTRDTVRLGGAGSRP
jgi:hypothetical protein